MASIDGKVGSNIRKSRKAKKLSLEALAKASGVSYTAIHRIEKGLHEARLATLEKIAKGLGIQAKSLRK